MVHLISILAISTSPLTFPRLDLHSDRDRAQLHVFRRLRRSSWNRHYVLFLQRAQLLARGPWKNCGQLLSIHSRSNSFHTPLTDSNWRPDTPITASKRCRRQSSWRIIYRRSLHHTRYFHPLAPRYTIYPSFLECCLYFNHTLYRGNRVSKISSYDLNAFHSPNFPPLVNGLSRLRWSVFPTDPSMPPNAVGIDIVVNWNEVLRQTNLRRFRAHKGFLVDFSTSCTDPLPCLQKCVPTSAGVHTSFSIFVPHCVTATLRLFPGMSVVTVRAFLVPPIRGIVLETFGAGNAPQKSDLMAALKQACDSGIVVVAITQCFKGSVSDAYETGRTLQSVGVVPGGDMTPEVMQSSLHPYPRAKRSYE